MMRPDHWLAYPPNRRRASRVGGTGTVIAATAAGLIAGLTQHSAWTTQLSPHRVTDAVLNTTTAQPSPAITPGATTPPTTANSDTPHTKPKGALDAAPTSGATPLIPDPPPGAAVPGDAAVPSAGTTIFRPYIRNGSTGTATQTTTGSAGTTSITTAPKNAARSSDPHRTSAVRHSATSDTAASGDTSGHVESRSSAHSRVGADDSDRAPTGSERTDEQTYPTPISDGSQTGGDSRSSGPSETAEPDSRTRITQALPPGFTPTSPRQSPTSATPAPTSWPAASQSQNTQPVRPAGGTESAGSTATTEDPDQGPRVGSEYQPSRSESEG